MKLIERISLTIFSVIILALCLILCLILFNWLEVSNLYFILQYLKTEPIATNFSLGFSIMLMLLAIKCIFFPSYSKEKNEKTEGILLENESGKLLISMDTIENLVKGVVVGFPNIKTANCKVKLDKQVNNVIIHLNLIVTPETVIKELSVNLQNKIKETIKNTTEIEVKEINIKIKNIEMPKEKKDNA